MRKCPNNIHTSSKLLIMCPQEVFISATSTEPRIYILHVPTAYATKTIPKHPQATCMIPKHDTKQKKTCTNSKNSKSCKLMQNQMQCFLYHVLHKFVNISRGQHQPQHASGSEDTCKASMNITSLIHQRPMNKKHISCTSSQTAQTCPSFTTIYTFSSFK